MPKVMKICKACGKQYEACQTPNPGIFRWRDVACSIECAEKYIHDVEVARGIIPADAQEPKAEPVEADEGKKSEPDEPSRSMRDGSGESGEQESTTPTRRSRRRRKK